MGFFVGPIVRVAMVNDFETAKQMANDENFCYRKVNYFATHLRGNGKKHIGVVNTSGEQWRRNRRFSLSTLKGELVWICIGITHSCILQALTPHCCVEFGLGKSVMAQNIEEEALEAMESLRKYDGKDVKIDQNFNIHIFNILWRIATNTLYNVSIVEIGDNDCNNEDNDFHKRLIDVHI